MTDRVIETVLFRAAPGADPEAFAQAAAATHGYVARCDGFISRCLSQTADGTWVDHVEWADLASVQAATAGFLKAPETAALLGLIDQSSLQMMHSTPAVLAA